MDTEVASDTRRPGFDSNHIKVLNTKSRKRGQNRGGVGGPSMTPAEVCLEKKENNQKDPRPIL